MNLELTLLSIFVGLGVSAILVCLAFVFAAFAIYRASESSQGFISQGSVRDDLVPGRRSGDPRAELSTSSTPPSSAVSPEFDGQIRVEGPGRPSEAPLGRSPCRFCLSVRRALENAWKAF